MAVYAIDLRTVERDGRELTLPHNVRYCSIRPLIGRERRDHVGTTEHRINERVLATA